MTSTPISSLGLGISSHTIVLAQYDEALQTMPNDRLPPHAHLSASIAEASFGVNDRTTLDIPLIQSGPYSLENWAIDALKSVATGSIKPPPIPASLAPPKPPQIHCPANLHLAKILRAFANALTFPSSSNDPSSFLNSSPTKTITSSSSSALDASPSSSAAAHHHDAAETTATLVADRIAAARARLQGFRSNPTGLSSSLSPEYLLFHTALGTFATLLHAQLRLDPTGTFLDMLLASIEDSFYRLFTPLALAPLLLPSPAAVAPSEHLDLLHLGYQKLEALLAATHQSPSSTPRVLSLYSALAFATGSRQKLLELLQRLLSHPAPEAPLLDSQLIFGLLDDLVVVLNDQLKAAHAAYTARRALVASSLENTFSHALPDPNAPAPPLLLTDVISFRSSEDRPCLTHVALHPFPTHAPPLAAPAAPELYYFEVSPLADPAHDGSFSIGFTTGPHHDPAVPLELALDDPATTFRIAFGPAATAAGPVPALASVEPGAVVGLGVDLVSREIFFTHQGSFLAKLPIPDHLSLLYPAVSLLNASLTVRFAEPFRYAPGRPFAAVLQPPHLAAHQRLHPLAEPLSPVLPHSDQAPVLQTDQLLSSLLAADLVSPLATAHALAQLLQQLHGATTPEPLWGAETLPFGVAPDPQCLATLTALLDQLFPTLAQPAAPGHPHLDIFVTLLGVVQQQLAHFASDPETLRRAQQSRAWAPAQLLARLRHYYDSSLEQWVADAATVRQIRGLIVDAIVHGSALFYPDNPLSVITTLLLSLPGDPVVPLAAFDHAYLLSFLSLPPTVCFYLLVRGDLPALLQALFSLSEVQLLAALQTTPSSPLVHHGIPVQQYLLTIVQALLCASLASPHPCQSLLQGYLAHFLPRVVTQVEALLAGLTAHQGYQDRPALFLHSLWTLLPGLLGVLVTHASITGTLLSAHTDQLLTLMDKIGQFDALLGDASPPAHHPLLLNIVNQTRYRLGLLLILVASSHLAKPAVVANKPAVLPPPENLAAPLFSKGILNARFEDNEDPEIRFLRDFVNREGLGGRLYTALECDGDTAQRKKLLSRSAMFSSHLVSHPSVSLALRWIMAAALYHTGVAKIAYLDFATTETLAPTTSVLVAPPIRDLWIATIKVNTWFRRQKQIVNPVTDACASYEEIGEQVIEACRLLLELVPAWSHDGHDTSSLLGASSSSSSAAALFLQHRGATATTAAAQKNYWMSIRYRLFAMNAMVKLYEDVRNKKTSARRRQKVFKAVEHFVTTFSSERVTAIRADLLQKNRDAARLLHGFTLYQTLYEGVGFRKSMGTQLSSAALVSFCSALATLSEGVHPFHHLQGAHKLYVDQMLAQLGTFLSKVVQSGGPKTQAHFDTIFRAFSFADWQGERGFVGVYASALKRLHQLSFESNPEAQPSEALVLLFKHAAIHSIRIEQESSFWSQLRPSFLLVDLIFADLKRLLADADLAACESVLSWLLNLVNFSVVRDHLTTRSWIRLLLVIAFDLHHPAQAISHPQIGLLSLLILHQILPQLPMAEFESFCVNSKILPSAIQLIERCFQLIGEVLLCAADAYDPGAPFQFANFTSFLQLGEQRPRLAQFATTLLQLITSLAAHPQWADVLITVIHQLQERHTLDRLFALQPAELAADFAAFCPVLGALAFLSQTYPCLPQGTAVSHIERDLAGRVTFAADPKADGEPTDATLRFLTPNQTIEKARSRDLNFAPFAPLPAAFLIRALRPFAQVYAASAPLVHVPNLANLSYLALQSLSLLQAAFALIFHDLASAHGDHDAGLDDELVVQFIQVQLRLATCSRFSAKLSPTLLLDAAARENEALLDVLKTRHTKIPAPKPCPLDASRPATDLDHLPLLRSLADAETAHVCTFALGGWAFVNQSWQVCETCSTPEEPIEVCTTCADYCHRGHTLRDPETSDRLCDCGAGAGHFACQRLPGSPWCPPLPDFTMPAASTAIAQSRVVPTLPMLPQIVPGGVGENNSIILSDVIHRLQCNNHHPLEWCLMDSELHISNWYCDICSQEYFANHWGCNHCSYRICPNCITKKLQEESDDPDDPLSWWPSLPSLQLVYRQLIANHACHTLSQSVAAWHHLELADLLRIFQRCHVNPELRPTLNDHLAALLRTKTPAELASIIPSFLLFLRQPSHRVFDVKKGILITPPPDTHRVLVTVLQCSGELPDNLSIVPASSSLSLPNDLEYVPCKKGESQWVSRTIFPFSITNANAKNSKVKIAVSMHPDFTQIFPDTAVALALIKLLLTAAPDYCLNDSFIYEYLIGSIKMSTDTTRTTFIQSLAHFFSTYQSRVADPISSCALDLFLLQALLDGALQEIKSYRAHQAGEGVPDQIKAWIELLLLVHATFPNKDTPCSALPIQLIHPQHTASPPPALAEEAEAPQPLNGFFHVDYAQPTARAAAFAPHHLLSTAPHQFFVSESNRDDEVVISLAARERVLIRRIELTLLPDSLSSCLRSPTHILVYGERTTLKDVQQQAVAIASLDADFDALVQADQAGSQRLLGYWRATDQTTHVQLSQPVSAASRLTLRLFAPPQPDQPLYIGLQSVGIFGQRLTTPLPEDQSLVTVEQLVPPLHPSGWTLNILFKSKPLGDIVPEARQVILETTQGDVLALTVSPDEPRTPLLSFSSGFNNKQASPKDAILLRPHHDETVRKRLAQALAVADQEHNLVITFGFTPHRTRVWFDGLYLGHFEFTITTPLRHLFPVSLPSTASFITTLLSVRMLPGLVRGGFKNPDFASNLFKYIPHIPVTASSSLPEFPPQEVFTKQGWKNVYVPNSDPNYDRDSNKQMHWLNLDLGAPYFVKTVTGSFTNNFKPNYIQFRGRNSPQEQWSEIFEDCYGNNDFDYTITSSNPPAYRFIQICFPHYEIHLRKLQIFGIPSEDPIVVEPRGQLCAVAPIPFVRGLNMNILFNEDRQKINIESKSEAGSTAFLVITHGLRRGRWRFSMDNVAYDADNTQFRVGITNHDPCGWDVLRSARAFPVKTATFLKGLGSGPHTGVGWCPHENKVYKFGEESEVGTADGPQGTLHVLIDADEGSLYFAADAAFEQLICRLEKCFVPDGQSIWYPAISFTGEPQGFQLNFDAEDLQRSTDDTKSEEIEDEVEEESDDNDDDDNDDDDDDDNDEEKEENKVGEKDDDEEQTSNNNDPDEVTGEADQDTGDAEAISNDEAEAENNDQSDPADQAEDNDQSDAAVQVENNPDSAVAAENTDNPAENNSENPPVEEASPADDDATKTGDGDETPAEAASATATPAETSDFAEEPTNAEQEGARLEEAFVMQFHPLRRVFSPHQPSSFTNWRSAASEVTGCGSAYQSILESTLGTELVSAITDIQQSSQRYFPKTSSALPTCSSSESPGSSIVTLGDHQEVGAEAELAAASSSSQPHPVAALSPSAPAPSFTADSNWVACVNKLLMEDSDLNVDSIEDPTDDLSEDSVLRFEIRAAFPSTEERKAEWLRLRALHRSILRVIPYQCPHAAEHPASPLLHFSHFIQLLTIRDKNSIFKRYLRALTASSTGSAFPNRVDVDRLNSGVGIWTKTIFYQFYRKFKKLQPASFLYASTNQAFEVNLIGESAIDRGGPYRECWSALSGELTSPISPLFVATTNQTGRVGRFRDCYVASPLPVDPALAVQYRFVGHIFVFSLASGQKLGNLRLAPLFWKKLCGEPVLHTDLMDVDVLFANHLDELERCDEWTFEDLADGLTFTIKLHGLTVVLVPNGEQIPVTFENRAEYIDLARKAFHNQGDAAIALIRQGIEDCISPSILSFVNSTYLNELICGKNDFSVDDLKKNYVLSSDFKENQPPITWFWAMLRSWTPENRVQFLKFVSGASSLPDHDSPAWVNFEIDELSGPGNDQLPTSSTCFNTLHLPRYTDEQIMQAKFLLAITSCDVIDNDYGGPNTREEEDNPSDDD